MPCSPRPQAYFKGAFHDQVDYRDEDGFTRSTVEYTPPSFCGEARPKTHYHTDSSYLEKSVNDLEYLKVFEEAMVKEQAVRHIDYAKLAAVLDRAYNRAAKEKGAERHGLGLPFEKQPMLTISEMLGSEDGILYQIMKKCQEASRLPTERAVKELLDIIVYAAGAIIYLEQVQK